jgi:hypothetical protein
MSASRPTFGALRPREQPDRVPLVVTIKVDGKMRILTLQRRNRTSRRLELG